MGTKGTRLPMAADGQECSGMDFSFTRSKDETRMEFITFYSVQKQLRWWITS
jgi:hypothetical protein